MIILNHVLVPHDFGDTSKTAMDYGIALARMFNAVLDVLHVRDRTDAVIPARFPRALYEELQTTVRERLLSITALDETKPIIDFHLRSGTADTEILRFAREQRTDLIVMGTHGRTGLAHAVMGSVAETVVRTAPCPVLSVRKPPREYSAPNILVPTDFGVAADTALSYGRTLAHTFGGRLHLLHVMENYFMRPIAADPRALEAAARRQLGERLAPSDRDALGASAILEVSDHPAAAIVEYANASHIDFIVMGTHGRQSMERLLTGSVAERVVRTASCPVLTVRNPEREFIVDDDAAAEMEGVDRHGKENSRRAES
jgi:nucleotide-binding universal stress UspA family protein